jgi:ribosome biogenesis protein SSF1/2
LKNLSAYRYRPGMTPRSVIGRRKNPSFEILFSNFDFLDASCNTKHQQNMARRRTKKRTHVGANNGPANKVLANQSRRDPKSMIIRIGAGEVGPSVSQLVKDVRAMMEPGTASRLKERRNNRLKDYLTMAGPLGVSHLLLFSRSESGNTNLRLALTPRGPTLHFQIEKYSLCKDIRKALKHPKGGGKESLSPPLVRPLWLGVALG